MGGFLTYCHVFPNGKLYFGKTQPPTEQHWRDGEGYSGNFRMYEEIKTSGWSSIKHVIIADNLRDDVAHDIEIILINKYETYSVYKGYNKLRYEGRHKQLIKLGEIEKLTEKYKLDELILEPFPDAKERVEEYRERLEQERRNRNPMEGIWWKHAEYQWKHWIESCANPFPIYSDPDYLEYRIKQFAIWKKEEEEDAQKRKEWGRRMYENDGFKKREADRIYWGYMDEKFGKKKQTVYGMQRHRDKLNKEQKLRDFPQDD